MNLFECLKYFAAYGVNRDGPNTGTTRAGGYVTKKAWFEKKYGENYYEYKSRIVREGIKSKAYAYRDELGRRLGDPSKVKRMP